MVEVPRAFRDMPRWWTDAAGRAWVDELPQLVAAQCARWRLESDGAAMHGSNALVVPVRRGGQRFALRLAPPGDDVEAVAEALRVWRGHGVVDLIDVDLATRALLLDRLDRLDRRRSLAALPPVDAVAELAEIARRLAVPVPTSVRTTAAIASEEAERFRRERATGAGRSPHLDAAIACAQDLASGGDGPLGVNGDLHADQVLAGPAGWTVVDPVLLRGDLEYDLGRVLWTRGDEASDDDTVTRLFDVFVERAGVPRERARRWVVTRSMSYLLWGLDHGLTEDPVRCRRLLDVFA
ncbi:aminoglycoside phosphotransferase family protein [Microbacterium sp. 10M-3C3]|jgi:streptomycin 6-kinase|uniref:aminoglycoside phosphotransferase family protein n=1 Tax=Microbacterium sp. 10M-3C3 TaxID=2483401 RepID=UPI000F62DBE2|nr:aminoglycoside phosphotransferase family protein [Microbacterium sp. 10M-3C3]